MSANSPVQALAKVSAHPALAAAKGQTTLAKTIFRKGRAIFLQIVLLLNTP